MTSQAFGVALLVGSGLIAFWICFRLTRLAPRSILWALIHIVLSIVALRSVPLVFDRFGDTTLPGAIYIEIFGIAFPALVYGFVSGGWLARAALGLLRP